MVRAVNSAGKYMQAAFPFLVRRRQDDNGIGTAFLASLGETTRLVTCAHTAEGTQPTFNFQNWPRNFELRVGGQWTSLPFFDGGTPLFTFRVRQETSQMADMMSIDLPGQVLEWLRNNFKVYKLDNPYTCSKGDKLAAYGYPDVSDTWPPSLQLSRGKALDESVLAEIPTKLGFSGGPVVAHGSKLAGMMLGTNDFGKTVVMRASVLAHLFV